MPHSRHHLKMDNLSFIGMAGCGKSTLGLALAKKLDLSFIDTDNLIEKKFEMSLEGVKNKFGYQFVRLAEEEVILSIDKSTKMISTGGSAVYSEASMNHLKSFSKIIYIDTPLETIIERIDEMLLRMGVGQTSIILKRNMVKQKKCKSETKNKPKNICGK